MLSPSELALERSQQDKYRFYYTPEGLDHAARPAHDYFAKLAARRLELVREHYTGGAVLDLCCGAGDYLLPVARVAERVIGVDFSPELVAVARRRLTEARLTNAVCLVGNGRAVPLETGSIALTFSFSSLYYIPRVEQVVAECARVLQPGGCAILEFGAWYSLNTLVCRAYPDLAAPCHLRLSRMDEVLAVAGFQRDAYHAFQILPLWGERPRWLRPLLHPAWKRLLARNIGGRMVDERLSALWPLRWLAFRHIMMCRKVI